jgi:hypothetical protein
VTESVDRNPHPSSGRMGIGKYPSHPDPELKKKGKKSMAFRKMSPGIFPHTCGREQGSMEGLPPGLGSVIVLTHYTTPRVHDRVELGEGILVLVCFEESGPWWFGTGFSDNVNHIPVWNSSRSLFPCDVKTQEGLRYVFLMTSTSVRL